MKRALKTYFNLCYTALIYLGIMIAIAVMKFVLWLRERIKN